MHNFKSERQRKHVMSRLKTRHRIDGTVVSYEGDVWVGKTKTRTGSVIHRYMNEEEAMRWSKKTGRKVEKL